MKKRNKFAIAVTAIILLLGILLVLTGFFGDWFLGLFSNTVNICMDADYLKVYSINAKDLK